MPDQPPLRRREDRSWHITPWRAAVIGAYLCLITYGVINENQDGQIQDSQADISQSQKRITTQAITDRVVLDRLANQSSKLKKNIRNTRQALCVEVIFLDNAVKINKVFIKEHPNDPTVPTRKRSVKETKQLTADLRRLVGKCS